MLNQDNEINSQLINKFYVFSNNNTSRKYEIKKDKKGSTPKANYNFKKVTGSGNINTSGSTPIVMFKKTSTKKANYSANDLNQINLKNINNNPKNEYISDGGLSRKIQKINNNINNNINSNMNNIYFNNYINEKSQQIPNNKNIKNNLDNNLNNTNTNTNINNNSKKLKEQQQIFSKTLRGFNKRPEIHKSEKEKTLVSITKNNSVTNKIKNKTVIQNINTGNNNTNKKNNKLNKQANNDDSKVQEDKKIIIMKKLVENGVIHKLKKLQNTKNKSTQKEKNEMRKREILENNGLPIDLSDGEEENNNDSKKNNNKEENTKNSESNSNTNKINNKQYMSKTTRGFYPKINNYMFSLDEYNNNEDKPSPLRAKKLKPSVNPFEFINRINNEKKKLNINSQFSPQHININHSNNIFQKRKIKSVNSELNDSFRHKNSRDKSNNVYFDKNMKLKNKSYNNNINKRSIDDFQDEFPFANKKNQRTSEEIKKYVKEKKIKNKKKEENILLEKNKKLFVLFKNLYNLNNFSKATPNLTNEHFYSKSVHQPTISTRGKAVMPSKNNLNKIELTNTNNSNIRKKKEINEYYIGNESTIKNNNSTLIDPNEYYLNVLESQQLFVNSGLNKIENDSLTSQENEKDTNDLNVSKEQIQKITTRESKKSNSSEKKDNSILNTNEYDNLKKEIENTSKIAGRLFSNKDKEKVTTEDNKTKKEVSNISDIKGKGKDKKEEQKEKKDEKEKDKNNAISLNRKNNKSPEINIESSNVIQPNKDTKENNLPSLSHTYSTKSNPNKKVEIEIEPRAVLNLVEIIKFIFQRKIFIKLYESSINRAIYQQYNISFAYFIAVCKHYPFRKLEEYCNYKTYYLAFRHLFKPFIRIAFRKFFKNCYTKKKIEYLVLFLNKLFKYKIYSKLYNYVQFVNKRNEVYIKKINPFVNILIKPYLKIYYDEFKNKIHLKDIKDINSNINKIEDKITKIENQPKIKNYEHNRNDDSINMSNSINNHRRKNDNSVKMNSYLYESFGSESKSLSLEPNSEDNDKLHQLKMMLLIKNNYGNIDNYHDLDDSITNSLNNSLKKISSKKISDENINAKINISDDEEIKKKDNENIDIIIEKDKNKSIEIDISADNDKSNEIEWGYNINTINSKGDKEDNKIKKIDKLIGNDDLIDDDYNDFEKDFNFDNDDKLINEKENKKELEKKEEEEKEKEKEKKKEKEKNNENEKEIKIEKEKEKEKEKKLEEEKEKEKKNEKEKEKEKEKENKNEKEEEKDIQILQNEIKQDKSRNLKQEENVEKNNKNDNIIINIKNEKEIKEEIDKGKEIIKEKNEKEKGKENQTEKEKEKEKENEKKREIFSQKIKKIQNPEEIANDLTEEILNKILSTEIKSSKKKLIPTKKFKFDKFDKMFSQTNSLNNSFGSVGNTHDNLSKEFGLSGLSQLSLADELLSLNDSMMSNYSANSVFNKTIKDKKKEHTLHLYFNVIAPKLIKIIRKEIIEKYPLIYENISTPMKNNSEKLMMSLALQDAELLRDNYKTTKNLISIANILDKDKILKNFEPINKKIRNIDNVTSDNFYDKMLNDCIVETAIEIINKERLYGKNGEPLKWSSRTHELTFKYKKDEPKKLANYVCKKLYYAIHNKVGLITDNYDNMSPEQINFERDRRLTKIIKRDLDDYEYQWNNLEMEETQLKVDNSELIMEQLYNEVIEILEHIQFSRLRPDLYQNKSIYACEEIPKLDFQLTTTEDATIPEGNDNNNDIINI